jgi:predicted RNA-binding protein with PIN domain
MRPVLGFTKKLPPRAVRSVRDALDGDGEFRERVADGALESELGRPSWLFLTRPDGWEQELAVFADAVAEEQRDTDAARSDADARRRAEQLSDTAERLRAELASSRDQLASIESALARERAAHLEVAAARDRLAARADELEAERARAVRQLKATEATSTGRLEQLRAAQAQLEPLRSKVTELESQLASGPGESEPAPAPPMTPVPDAGADLVELRASMSAAVGRAARAAAELGDALASAAAVLVEDASSVPVPSGDVAPARPAPAGSVAATPAARPPRRVPVRLHSGVHDGSPEGLAQLLGVDDLVAIVDGYNVTMEGWPSLDQQQQRESLVSALGGLQARVPATLHVVFDGAADGRRPSVAAPLPVRVHFSAEGVEADDVILDMVARLPTDTAVLVVSSDRRVADGARRLGANAVRSSVLLELLRR